VLIQTANYLVTGDKFSCCFYQMVKLLGMKNGTLISFASDHSLYNVVCKKTKRRVKTRSVTFGAQSSNRNTTRTALIRNSPERSACSQTPILRGLFAD
jgi:hypothetical protein